MFGIPHETPGVPNCGIPKIAAFGIPKFGIPALGTPPFGIPGVYHRHDYDAFSIIKIIEIKENFVKKASILNRNAAKPRRA